MKPRMSEKSGADENTYILEEQKKVQSSDEENGKVNKAKDSDLQQLISDCQENDNGNGSSMSETAFNYINSIIGSGIIGQIKYCLNFNEKYHIFLIIFP